MLIGVVHILALGERMYWEAGTLHPMEHPEMLYLPPSLPGSTPKKPEMVRNPTEGNLPDLEKWDIMNWLIW